MSMARAEVFTCDLCKTKDYGVEGAYDVPLDWFTIRISKYVSAGAADDLHICPSCKYEDLISLWEKI